MSVLIGVALFDRVKIDSSLVTYYSYKISVIYSSIPRRVEVIRGQVWNGTFNKYTWV